MSEIVETLDQPGGAAADDLSALSWVNGELRRSLEAAHKALRRHLKESDAARGSDLGSVDPSVLRSARVHLHQGVGALEMVGLPQAATVLRASEAAVQRMVARPAMLDSAAVESLERASFALLDFLGRKLARKDVSPVMLFPQYRAVQQLAAAERIHPADLWPMDWSWHELKRDPRAKARSINDSTRTEMETLVLTLMRQVPGDAARDALMRMSDLCADLGAGALESSFGGPQVATFWQLAAAVFEAQSRGLLQPDSYSKRLASGMLAQLRLRMRGPVAAPERLAQDLLFFCSHAQAPASPQASPRLAEVRQAWSLDAWPSADYENARLGRHDPAVLALARKRVSQAKDAWSAVAGGELHRLGGLPELFLLVGESLQRLFPEGESLARSLQAAVTQTVSSNAEPPAALAMEAATAILYVDASLDDGQFDHPELAQRVQHLARRIDEVRIGAEPQPLDTWMEELYRRVSDRQTMGSVVQELRASLSEIEKQIDQYFRDPSRRELLIPVPGQLSAMRGVLSVLGMDQASHAALHMRDDVEALAQTEVDPQMAIRAGTFDRLANNLGALSFLIDMLSVQPQLAKSLFRFDAETGSLSAVMGQSERVSAFAAFDEIAEAPTLRQDVEKALVPPPAEPQPIDINNYLSETTVALPSATRKKPAPMPVLPVMGMTLPAVPAVPAAAAPARPAQPVAVVSAPPAPATTDTGLEDDAEMREIFIEEAREVVADAQAAIERLVDAPDNATDLTAVRRAFHTLKGSSRMVGLREFGEASWACEQLYNDRLATAPRMDATLRTFTVEALAYLADWTEAIADGRSAGHRAAEVAQSADSLRLRGERLSIALPQAPAAAPIAAAPVPLPLPLAEDVTLALPAVSFEATITMPAPTPAPLPLLSAEEFPALDFDLQDEVAEELEAAPDAVPAPVTALQDRVPGLPSAADLDLGELTVAMPAQATEPSFDFDLNDLDLPDLPEPAAAARPAAPADRVDSLLNLPLDLEPEAEPELATPLDTPIPEAEAIEMDLGELNAIFGASASEPQLAATQEAASEPEPVAAPVDEEVQESVQESVQEAVQDVVPEAPQAPLQDEPSDADEEDEQIKVIGPLRISIPLFNIYLNEADELSRRLGTELAEWAIEWERHPVSETAVALAHSLAGSSATVGYSELSALARALEHALMRSHAHGHGRPGEPGLFSDVADDIRRLLHQFAAGFLRSVSPDLMERLAEHERLPVEAPLLTPSMFGEEFGADGDLPEAMAEAEPEPEPEHEAEPEAEPEIVDAIDAELFPIFEEEADELLPQLQTRLREWLMQPAEADAPMACMRTLHTLKGGARLAGAMRIGELAHRLETAIEALTEKGVAQAAEIEPLLAHADAMSTAFDAMRHRRAPAPADVAEPAPEVIAPLAEPAAEVPAEVTQPEEPEAVAVAAVAAVAEQAPIPAPTPAPVLHPVVEPSAVDWQRFVTPQAADAGLAAAAAVPATGGSNAVVRVRAGLLDRLVNQAGEVSITRARIDSDVKQMQASLGDLTESMERMRRQLRDIELQAETQITTRIEAAKAAAQTFDPLEMDRFTRFQELTRFMAESVNDVATLQRSLQRTLQSTEDELAAQARLTRELQDDLLRTRMIEFDSISERLFRTVRQAAKETAKQVKVEVVGGAIEIDRGVLERMVGSFEHLLRNCVAHGIELPEARKTAGKDATGVVTITVSQAGNEVAVEFADDGAGLDLTRIRQRGIERGLLAADAKPTAAELASLIFAPGFSTAESVTELAGRGVGLDVVRAEVNAMGGRVETATEPGKGTRFRLLLPLTTAVTQVVMLRCGELQVAVPSPLIEIVRRTPTADVERAYGLGQFSYGGEEVPFYWLAALLRAGNRGGSAGRTQTVVIVRSAAQRVAVHVDEVLGNQEVVVKNVGPQLSRLPGLAGVTLLPSGVVALIYNPVALSNLYGDEARERQRPIEVLAPAAVEVLEAGRAPLVMVVDDSLTVRRVTQRLLVREGYRVVLAKDGLDALERLTQERPVLLLSDIEMPRMDGFDLVRNVRSDAALKDLPVVMITSRIAQKHREYAAELGVQHYLGKPYSEEELLGLVARYAKAAAASAARA